MAYYPDLSPYTQRRPLKYVNTYSIGWLDGEHPYPKGSTDLEFTERLLAFCDRALYCTRGYHRCPFCLDDRRIVVRQDEREIYVDNGELWIEGATAVYVAPTMIYHYITKHGYRPPDAFVQAVNTASLPPLGNEAIRRPPAVDPREAGVTALALDNHAVQGLTQELVAGESLSLRELARILLGIGPALNQNTLVLLVSHTRTSRSFGRLLKMDEQIEDREFGMKLRLETLVNIGQFLVGQDDGQDLAWLWQDLREGNWLIAPANN
jgi:hypothetical protein